MSRGSYLEQAFHLICAEAKTPEGWYVCLMERSQTYGGPEEGGWWRTICELVAYQEFPTEELANAAAEEVRKMACELNEQANRQYGEYCLQSMEWLEARGLDADFLPEPDGPSEYYVTVSDEINQGYRGPSSYS